jgi:NADH-quinone oxidoreductase subunit F
MITFTVGMATCGVSAGAEKVHAALKELAGQGPGVPVSVGTTGCVGMCYREPLVEVRDNAATWLYADVTEEKIKKIFDNHVTSQGPVADWVILKDNKEGDEYDYLKKQVKIVLRNCGFIDPDSLDDYLGHGGYKAIRTVLAAMTPEQVIETILASGLRGRGGGGFSTGMKWKFARQSRGADKYVICNADEGDPGAFMDRSVLEGDPHSVLEGMMICGYAIGASHGYIYCRAEYPMAVRRLLHSIAVLEEKGMLGDNIFGSGFSFHIRVKEGAGAFVCGEETALISSIEGKRGTPKVRPPYPAVRGLWGKPTNINNVETFANVPWIIMNGAEKYAAMGTEKSKGTKVFAIAGKALKTGLVEVPMGITISEVVHDVCGGIRGGKQFKAVQMGGPSGGCIPASLSHTHIDYEEITKLGAIMGSGGMIVLDEETCMVELARFFLQFTQNESCGKCTSCRVGTLRMLEILERIVAGQGKMEDIETLQRLAPIISRTSSCGLGMTAPNPVLTTLKYFREEYEAHIRDHVCPSHSCTALVNFIIDPEKCTGCTLCSKNCPVKAITGERKLAHTINQELCVKCGKCHTVCTFGAIYKD